MKIYTKGGDEGQTALFGGERVPKHHLRIESYGTVDELNSFVGLVRDQGMDEHTFDILIEIQDRLFTLGSMLATPDDKGGKIKIPKLSEDDITLLEKEIDIMTDALPPLKSFVLPGGHTTVSYCHIARTVCRRAERLVTHLAENDVVDPLVMQYLNRLSDYLFTLSRKLSQDLGANEVEWKPRM
ncbi:MAG: cob(I)yrinic acid a,c-diamide adenosyltransferase [Sphingobacteriales bacterium JAD_PAG50586_3]|nr:MAG: cob(I)yrinic acid a,c-diamide adenosyltransferase [Sphingobacteriales bacterium JAD_PAG50586_3]